MQVQVPQGVGPGQMFQVNAGGTIMNVQVRLTFLVRNPVPVCVCRAATHARRHAARPTRSLLTLEYLSPPLDPW